jgi:glycogen debranching enzyme
VFAEYVSEGMIPNRFDDYTNEPEYNTVDASLWFIHACLRVPAADAATTRRSSRSCSPPAARSSSGYRKGTRYHIRDGPGRRPDHQGDPTRSSPGWTPRWDDIAFTPRQGKAVEINALWYHALC